MKFICALACLLAAFPPVASALNMERPHIVWHNKATGQNRLWQVQNGVFQSSLALTSNGCCDYAWKIVGLADFNADGNTDILWQHPTYPYPAIWWMNSSGQYTGHTLLPAPGAVWRIVGVADFDRDGKTDLLFQGQEGTAWAHQTAVWYMTGANGASIREVRHSGDSGSLYFPNSTDSAWRIVGVANMDGDNVPDILWWHSTYGMCATWHMTGQYGNQILSTPQWTWQSGGGFYFKDRDWHIVGTGDYGGDSQPDILFRHGTLGLNGCWIMSNDQVVQERYDRPGLHEYDTDWRTAHQPMEESTWRIDGKRHA